MTPPPRSDALPLPFVSIVVPARNEESSIAACVESLLAQSYPAELLEVIVADGRSVDRTRDIVAGIATRDARLRLVDNAPGTTPAGMNAGIRAARGSVIGVMSAHAIAEADLVRVAVADLATMEAWGVGGRIVRQAEGSVAASIALVTSSPVGVGDASHNYATGPGWVETAFPGTWPRWVFETVGLFDEELVRNQDDELSLRIREAGGRIWYDPAIRVRYVSRRTRGRLFSQYRQYGFWKVRVLQKHPTGLRPRHFVPAAWVAWVGAGIPLALVVSPMRPVVALGIAAYGLVVLAGTRPQRRDVPWRDLIASAVVLHAAYGIGFLQGLVVLAPRWFTDRRGVIEHLPAPHAPA